MICHAVRCGLYHEAEFPKVITFSPRGTIGIDDGRLKIASSIVFGLITAVVTSPGNHD